MVVVAVGMCRRTIVLRRATSSRFRTYSIPVWVSDAKSVAKWVGLRPGRTSRCALQRRQLGGVCLLERLASDQHAVHDDGELWGDGNRDALEAEPLAQLQSRRTHLRRSHSDRLRASNTVAAS